MDDVKSWLDINYIKYGLSYSVLSYMASIELPIDQWPLPSYQSEGYLFVQLQTPMGFI